MDAEYQTERAVDESIGIDKKVAFLRQPAAYPYPVKELKVKETHMSWVFLAGDFVYKLKKPVSYSYFDHGTLASRLHNSREEIRINQTLGKDIYVGIVPLVININGALQLEGKGKVIDWLVKMKRIREDQMLDYAIAHHAVDKQVLQDTIAVLIEFYKNALVQPMPTTAFIKKLEAEISFNNEHLLNPLFEMPGTLVRKLIAGQLGLLSSNYALFDKRVSEKRIVDAHGDLRPEHICLWPDPLIIDRLEFSKELRIMDITEELSFLSVECELMGNEFVGRLFIDAYRRSCDDDIPRSLILFYKVKRACLRAFLVARHVEEKQYKADPQWQVKALAYIQKAVKYHAELAS